MKLKNLFKKKPLVSNQEQTTQESVLKSRPKLPKGKNRREILIQSFKDSKMPDKFEEPKKQDHNQKNKKGNN